MNKIIYFGDLHIKESEPHRTASLNFLKWLLENYKDDIIICGGDFWDSSSVNHMLVSEAVSILKQFKDFRLITGNHELSKRMGNILKPLSQHINITLYNEMTEVNLGGIDFIILPHTYSKNKEYEDIKDNNPDYSLSHFMPIQEAFGDEGIELKFNVKVAHIFSHIHRHAEYKDNFGNNILIAGSVINTRQGEQEWPKYIYELQKDKYIKIEVPYYFTYKTINYGDEIEKNNDIINIVNAPSIQSVLDKYKGYYIREEGIELEEFKSEEIEKTEFEKDSIQNKFLIFALSSNMDKELKNCCLEYLGKEKKDENIQEN